MRLNLPQFPAPDDRKIDHIGEVVVTTTTKFVAESFAPDELSYPPVPALGSWVKSFDEEEGHTILGVVCLASTEPIDAFHRVRALGLSLAEIREQQPQLFGLQTTHFEVVIVGFRTETQRYFHYLPPRPPQLHQSVFECNIDEILQFTENLDYMRTLLEASTNGLNDALLAANIRLTYKIRKAERDWLVKTGRQINQLLLGDYDRLRAILGQLKSY
jgi:hypothetical protein